MITYFFLIVAILLEVAGTMLLPVTNSFSKPIPTIIMALCYLGALFLLTVVVKTLPIAVVYATWSGWVFSSSYSWVFYFWSRVTVACDIGIVLDSFGCSPCK